MEMILHFVELLVVIEIWGCCFGRRVSRGLFGRLFQYNFVGRILGPRGMTAKQLEQETGCKIMVRGKGSMRDKKKVSSLSPSVCSCSHTAL